MQPSQYQHSKKHVNMHRIFEKRILRIFYKSITDKGACGTRYNKKLYTLYNELDIVKVIKTGRLRRL